MTRSSGKHSKKRQRFTSKAAFKRGGSFGSHCVSPFPPQADRAHRPRTSCPPSFPWERSPFMVKSRIVEPCSRLALTPQPTLPNWERGSRRSNGGEGRKLNH